LTAPAARSPWNGDPTPHGSPLDIFVPRPDIRERHETLVHAPAQIVFDVACDVDLQSLPVVRTIFWLRSKLLRSAPATHRAKKGLVAETKSLGWGVLAIRPGRELVMGAVTQPWLPNPVFVAIAPDKFAAFADPDLVKIAWTLEAIPLDGTRTRFASETRAVATDDGARAKFRRYWRRVGMGVILIRWLVGPAVRREAERRYRAGASLAKVEG
jgi:hypothetical protein